MAVSFIHVYFKISIRRFAVILLIGFFQPVIAQDNCLNHFLPDSFNVSNTLFVIPGGEELSQNYLKQYEENGCPDNPISVHSPENVASIKASFTQDLSKIKKRLQKEIPTVHIVTQQEFITINSQKIRHVFYLKLHIWSYDRDCLKNTSFINLYFQYQNQATSEWLLPIQQNMYGRDLPQCEALDGRLKQIIKVIGHHISP